MAYQSGEWVIEFRENTAAARLTAWVKPPQLHWSIKNSEKGEMTCELPIGMDQYDGTPFTFRRDGIVPWHTDWYLYRGTTLRDSGIVTSINLADDRDTVLVSGMNWLGYLENRTYPFDPEAYVNERDWASWPKKWGVGLTNGVDLRIIVEDIMEAMIEAVVIGANGPISAAFYTPPFILANPNTGQDGRYKILPADETTIYDHIKKISENSDGFEFDILPQNLEFKMYSPNRDQGTPVYRFTKNERLIELDWTNEGPLATVTTIYGTGSSIKRGVVRTDFESIIRYRWTDRIANAGQVASQVALEKAAQGHAFEDRFPRKRASFAIHDPELLTPNFWTGGRPRNLIGNRVRVTHDFFFHKVNADYRVMGLNIDVDEHGNEKVSFDAEMINTPDAAVSFGGGGGGFEAA
jgi:hypothetical protein